VLNELRVIDDPLARADNQRHRPWEDALDDYDREELRKDAYCCPDETGFLRGAYGDDLYTATIALDSDEAAELYMEYRKDYLASRQQESMYNMEIPGSTTTRGTPVLEGKITKLQLTKLVKEELDRLAQGK